MAENGDNNANINQNGDPPTSVRRNLTSSNQNPNPAQLDIVQVPTREFVDMKATLERVTKELHDLKS